eukprot:TRINITY_DN11916_c0_g1_i1.p1 TRINITY_DN11916_c0_g1~~TRINITY_DN11916_c0_g1_i1.p1  ORF type:complete len:414 (-),score=69.93 TRINITY_DN11916_c0_g1_i1:55-1296(-)
MSMDRSVIQNFFQNGNFATGDNANNSNVGGSTSATPATYVAPIVQAPQLNLIKQTSLAEEMISKNGLERPVHVLVKNTPFQLTIGFTSSDLQLSPNYNFNRLALDVSLLYDCDDLTSVAFIKTKPITFKPKIIENGEKITLNCRLKVLTSQHEDMFFRVRIKALKPVTLEELEPHLEVVSAPIKVVSKPEQLKGRRKTTTAKRTRSKKRNVTDMLVETVNDLQKKLQVHQQIFEAMLDPQNQLAQSPSQARLPADLINRLYNCGDGAPPAKRRRIETVVVDNPPVTTTATPAPTSAAASANPSEIAKEQFERAFANLLQTYSGMNSSDRALMVRKVVKNRSVKENESLTELVDMLSAECVSSAGGVGLLVPGSFMPTAPSNSSGHSAACGSQCRHKKELQKIDDEFFATFFAS